MKEHQTQNGWAPTKEIEVKLKRVHSGKKS